MALADARDEAAWEHTAWIAAALFNCQRKAKDWVEPDDLNPLRIREKQQARQAANRDERTGLPVRIKMSELGQFFIR